MEMIGKAQGIEEWDGEWEIEMRVETREDLLTDTEITFPCQVNEDFLPFPSLPFLSFLSFLYSLNWATNFVSETNLVSSRNEDL